MEQIVVNKLNDDGMVEVKIISDKAVEERRMLVFVPKPVLEFAVVNCYDTSALSMFYGEVKYPARQVVEFFLPHWKKPRKLVVWRFIPEEGFRISEVIEHVADWYFVQTHRRPGWAFVWKLPNGIENFTDVDGVTMIEVDWCPKQCVLIGGVDHG